MSKKFTLVTGNPGKAASLRRYLEPLGFEIDHEDVKDIVEPQLDNIEEVALSKARQAYKKLKKPLLVEDTGFYIEALNNFPGPYTKYTMDTIGTEGYLALLEGKTNRNCKFFSALVYIDEEGKEHIFTNEVTGTLAEAPDNVPLRADAKSELWKIYIPSGSNKTLNELDGEERKALFKTWENKSVAILFANSLRDKKTSNQNKKIKRNP